MAQIPDDVLAEKRFASLDLRQVLAAIFRRRYLVIAVFAGIVALVAFKIAGHVPQYRAGLTLMLNRDRVDSAVTADGTSVLQNRGLMEEDVNSEVHLLQSRDLLKKVAKATAKYQVDPEPTWFDRIASLLATKESKPASDEKTEAFLDGFLEVEPIRRSSLIAVYYTCSDPKQAARVLNTLADLYLDKHLEVHRPRGAFEFFQNETERYREGLVTIETRLSSFGRNEGVVSAQVMKTNIVQKLTEFEAKLKETQAEILEIQQRIHSYEAQLAATPPRMKTLVSASNAQVQLKSNLINLEAKRAEMLGKYDSSYRLVKDLEDQISAAREALEEEQNRLLVTNETTDRNPVYQMLTSELVKAKSELPAVQTRAKSILQSIQSYRVEAQVLDQKGIMEQDLLRAHKMAEENYQLYVKKQEEARIANALDRQKIVNVTVTEKATVPNGALPSRRLLTLLVGCVLGALVSLGLAVALEFLTPVFYTPRELETALKLPVLAAFPKR